MEKWPLKERQEEGRQLQRRAAIRSEPGHWHGLVWLGAVHVLA